MSRRLSLFIILCLIVLVTASLVVLYEKGFLTPKPTSNSSNSPDAQNIFWQSSLEHLATNFTVADGKVFVTDDWGDIYTYDTQTGKSVWNASIGGYGPHTVKTYDGKVYASGGNSLVYKLDENTGAVELTFEAPAYSGFKARAIPSFLVADGKVFALHSGIAVYYATTGELLWSHPYEGDRILNSANTPTSKSSFAFIQHYSNSLNTVRLDPNNGSAVWSVQGYASEPAIVSQEQVVLWNYASNVSFIPPDEHIILCLNIDSGRKLWDFDAGAPVFQPTISNGLLLFGAQDGYFYALNTADGTLKWKTFIDPLSLIVNYNYHSQLHQSGYLVASVPLVDNQNNRVFWNIMVGNNGQDKYSGTILSLDLTKGSRKWVTPISNKPSYSTNNNDNMALLNNTLYVNEQLDLYSLDASSGNIQWKRTFDHNLLTPIRVDDKIFVVADGYVIAYE